MNTRWQAGHRQPCLSLPQEAAPHLPRAGSLGEPGRRSPGRLTWAFQCLPRETTDTNLLSYRWFVAEVRPPEGLWRKEHLCQDVGAGEPAVAFTDPRGPRWPAVRTSHHPQRDSCP